ncbi:MAG TPA: CRISPR-associated protein Csm7, partial [Accumulibacter sp.]|nr:CRISPR-associated protein Csm7 [Accumulibacter sp.]
MAHTLHRATLALHTPLGTPLAGDTLFGQLCWALREAAGEAELRRRLHGYTAGHPWLVVSDGFPAGYLPRPTLPHRLAEPSAVAAEHAGQHAAAERKAARQKRWLAVDHRDGVLSVAPAPAVDDATAYGQAPQRRAQAHNTLDRRTGTTGGDPFVPYSVARTFHAAGQAIDLYLVLDEERTTAAEVGALLAAVGQTGFGRDAGIGLGKFSVARRAAVTFAVAAAANAHWTLAPCAPQGQGFSPTASYWQVLTRFGRHGNIAARGGTPFKTPVLLAATGAVFVSDGPFTARLFVGQGIGGDGRLSKSQPDTVQQGYAPVVSHVLE